MKPAAFDYERPGDIDEAVRLLGTPGVFSKIIAGSQSLGPMLNLRLAQPELLIDICAIAELRSVSEQRDYIEIGACVTHADIEDDRIPDGTRGFMRNVAAKIAYRAVRNRGTLGGSLAHADPAADWVSVLPLLGAEITTRSGDGGRTISAADLMVSSFVTTLKPNEIIRSIRIPKLSRDARWGFFKFNQKAGEFAHAIGGILYDPSVQRFHGVIGAIETAPIVIPDAQDLFHGPFGPDMLDRFDEGKVLSMLDKKGVRDSYSRHLAVVALKRAAKQASGS